MRRQTTTSNAFTLVELLAVIAILVLLVSMLVPVVMGAREMAVRAQCLSNLHNIAAAGLGFAAEHGGRGPGRAQRGWMGTTVSGSGLSWANILDAEYFKYPAIGALGCPSYKIYKLRWYRHPFSWNDAAAGGGFLDGNAGQWSNPVGQNLGVDPNFPHESQYGLAVDPGQLPRSIQPYYTAIDKAYPTYNGTLAWYNLGARLSNFPDPSYTYLIIEADGWGSFYGSSSWATNPPGTVINASPNGGRIEGPNEAPPWDGSPGGPGDFYGFRHTRPADYGLYQAKVTAGFAFVDGHVEVMNANVPDQNHYKHFALEP